MPLFKLRCPEGHEKELLTIAPTFDKVPIEKKTCSCGAMMVRSGTGPTANVKETLDSGLMVRKVERYADAPRLYHERAKNADPNAGKKNRS